MLRTAGAKVTEVIAYRTLSPDSIDETVIRAIQAGIVDVIVFFSPSAFHHLLDLVDVRHLQSLAGKMCLAAIGPATARTIREAGLLVPIQAEEATTSALVQSLVQYCAQQQATGGQAK
jgi:uroporphyrinogen III methyltransferase/synthase